MLVRYLNLFNDLNQFEKSVQGFLNNTKWKPAVDIYKDGENTTIEIELPGLDIEDIDVTTNNGVLIIKGEKKVSKKSKEYLRTEGFSGSFKRSFTLPYDTDIESINAQYRNGILIVNIPKSLDKFKRIEIKNAN